ncbi:MAG: outer membrane beta-barrel protein [Steroidobacteraceae bacterium]
MRTLTALGLVMVSVAAARAAAVDETNPVEFYVADQITYDDNLFRVPPSLMQTDPAAVTVQSISDYLNRASAGVHARWSASRQVFLINLRLDNVNYSNNTDLDYFGGSGDLTWNWQAGKRWSGLFTGQYDRALASYANYQFFGKDIVGAANYGAEIRFAVGSRWSLLAAGAETRTNHSAVERQIEEFHSQTGRAGLEYKTPSENVFAAEYRYTDARFPNVDPLLSTFAHQYTERTPTLRMHYAFTDQTKLDARYGYLKRTYDDPTATDFAGGVWDATLRWEPTEKLAFDVNAWHDLRAYADSESEYFIAEGVSVGPIWSPRTRLVFSLLASYEDQSYVSAGVLIVSPLPVRKAKVGSGQLAMDYWPTRALSFRVQYRYLDYSSNRALEDYNDNLVSVQVRYSF